MEIILNYLNTNPWIMLSLFAIVVIIALEVCVKKFGIKWISVAGSIVNCIKNNLVVFGIANDKLYIILNLIAQAITSVTIIDAELNLDIKVNDGVDFVKNVAKELDLTITDDESKIIADVIKAVFIFMSTLNIKPTNLKYERLAVSANKLMIKERKMKNNK